MIPFKRQLQKLLFGTYNERDSLTPRRVDMSLKSLKQVICFFYRHKYIKEIWKFIF